MIKKVAGPLVMAEIAGARKGDLVKLGEKHLIGEIIELRGPLASIQVYEETAGLKVGDPVSTTGAPLSVELGPGLIGSIFDGIERPLQKIMERSGAFIGRGIAIGALPRDKKREFVPVRQAGETDGPGDVLGTVKETAL